MYKRQGGTGTPTLGNSLGAKGGEETHQLIIGEMPRHRHLVPQLTQLIPGRAGNLGVVSKNDGDIGTEFTDNVGSDAPHNNIQPSLILNYIIKY